jgi:hypothetical protein
MQTTKNSHYVSQVLLKRWKHPTRHTLTCFDFRTGVFAHRSTRRTYVSETALPQAVEQWLSDNIESPIGDYFAEIERALGAGASAPPDPTERGWRAIRLALVAQGARTAQAKVPDDEQLIDLASRSVEYINDLVVALGSEFRTTVAFAPGEGLCYPDAGFVVLPLIGAMAIFVPLHPRVFAVSVPNYAFEGSLEQMIGYVGIPTMLSVGLEGDIVVLPPLRDGSEEVMAKWVRESRGHARRLVDLHQRLNDTIAVDVTRAQIASAARRRGE